MADKSVSTESLAINTGKPEYKGKKLRVAIVGCGGIAHAHLNAFKSIPEIEVVAGVDIDPARLKVMEDQWNVHAVYADWKKMLKEVQPDAVDVCTPNGVHCAPVVDGLNAGCHAYVEKPMAMTPAECAKMVAAAKKARRKLSVGFQYRYHPATQFLVRARDEGQFGNIMFVKCQALRRRGIPNWGVFGQKKLQGGGPMIDIGVHVIEMAHYFMGAPNPVAASGNIWTYMGNKPSQVQAIQWPNWDYKTYTVEDLAIGQIRFANGAIMQIESSFAAHIEKDIWNFTAIGDKGGCSWDPAGIYTDRAGSMTNTTPAFLGASGWDYLFPTKLRNWVSGCLHGTDLMASGEDGWAVQKILDGVYRSAEAGKEVVIK